MTKEKLGQAFDLWMQEYLTNTEAFTREFQDVQDWKDGDGVHVTEYGKACASYLKKLLKACE